MPCMDKRQGTGDREHGTTLVRGCTINGDTDRDDDQVG
jgi:hypothetical protein